MRYTQQREKIARVKALGDKKKEIMEFKLRISLYLIIPMLDGFLPELDQLGVITRFVENSSKWYRIHGDSGGIGELEETLE